MGKKKKKQTRAEPKTTLSWLCSNTAMPRFLRWDLNNLLISQKAKKEKTDDV